MEEQKLTKKEVENIKNVLQNMQTLQIKLGQLERTRHEISKEVEKVHKEMTLLQSQYSNNLEEIEDKYGEGNIDLETEKFIPNKK